MIPETRYARTADGVGIAYQVIGFGPVDLVLIKGFVAHLEVDWEEPRVARFFRRLAEFSRLILFDQRGTGLSDRSLPVPEMESRAADLRAVLDAAGSERTVLCGEGVGGCLGAFFAATYPERAIAMAWYAAASEVLVSRTVKDLVAGSGLAFEDRGTYALKGVPDEWHLYAVASGQA